MEAKLKSAISYDFNGWVMTGLVLWLGHFRLRERNVQIVDIWSANIDFTESYYLQICNVSVLFLCKPTLF